LSQRKTTCIQAAEFVRFFNKLESDAIKQE